MQQQEAELQESHLQATYEQAMAGHLTCLLQQVRDTAEAAAAQEGATEGGCGAALGAALKQLQGVRPFRRVQALMVSGLANGMAAFATSNALATAVVTHGRCCRVVQRVFCLCCACCRQLQLGA